MIKELLRNIILIFDKLLNVLLLGSPHRTVSMRLSFAVYCAYVKPRYFWVKPLAEFVDVLFHNSLYTLERAHIFNSYEADEILSIGLWRWYDIVEKDRLDALERKVSDLRFEGRRWYGNISTIEM